MIYTSDMSIRDAGRTGILIAPKALRPHTKAPAQSFVAPVFAVVTAATRCKPGVCAMFESNCSGRTIRTPLVRHRLGNLFMCSHFAWTGARRI
jgi:hypothetical protein